MKHFPWIAAILILTSCSHSETITLTDVDGNTYPAQSYDGVVWMTENLKTTHAPDGSKITFYFPNGEASLANTYGLLYDFKTACEVCPTGWRLPTNDDWDALFKANGGRNAEQYKDADAWSGEENSNASGFSVRPAGYGNNGAFADNFGLKTYLWSRTQPNEHDVWTMILEDGPTVRPAPQHPTYAFSIRCVKAE